MNLRHVKKEDVEEIKQIAMDSWLDTYREIMPEEDIKETVTNWYRPEDLTKQVKDPVFYVSEDKGRIEGFIHASIEEEEAKLHRLYVRPTSQRKGIGGKLYDRAEEAITDSGCKSIRLEVMSKNRKGLNFYLKKGFGEEKEEKVELNGYEIKQKVLVKELD